MEFGVHCWLNPELCSSYLDLRITIDHNELKKCLKDLLPTTPITAHESGSSCFMDRKKKILTEGFEYLSLAWGHI